MIGFSCQANPEWPTSRILVFKTENTAYQAFYYLEPKALLVETVSHLKRLLLIQVPA